MALRSDIKKAFDLVILHKLRFLDFAFVIAAIIAFAYFAVVVDIFTNHDPTAKAVILEVDEMLVVSTALFVGMTWAVRRLLRERRDAARQAAVEREMRALAFNDALTGLPNRRRFDDALAELAAAIPSGELVHSLLMLDLNGFKRVNDVYGHATGDEVLKQVAKRISASVRKGDLIARLGGDEFAVLATHLAGSEAVEHLASRIIDSLTDPVAAGGSDHAIGTAIGIALIPQDGVDPVELKRRADVALYRAKAERQSAMRFFEATMDFRVRERDKLERDLRDAISAHAIVPHYQPIVDVQTGHIRGFEVLARWHHPELGEVAPDRFVPIAEEVGLIGPLTEQLLLQAFADARYWPAYLELCFNLSPVLLRNPRFSLQILVLLGHSGFSPNRLELEIAEAVLLRDADALEGALGAIHDSGIKIALDGFGTGYLSLSRLRSLHVDRLKIDRSFVAAMTSDKEGAAIVGSLIGLGAGFGLEIAAEGVETEEQRTTLAQLGCQQAQGVLYSGPISAAEVTTMLSGRATMKTPHLPYSVFEDIPRHANDDTQRAENRSM